jgi:hypothetical protein
VKPAVLAFEYLTSASPTTRGIAAWLRERAGSCDLVTNHPQNLPPEGLVVLDVPAVRRVPWPARGLRGLRRAWRRRARAARWDRARDRLAAVIGAYDMVVAGEFDSLKLLDDAGYPLEQVVYLSLESSQVAEQHEPQSVRRCLEGCRLRLIQGPERHRELEAALGYELDFAYLPVSVRPPSIDARDVQRPAPPAGGARLVHSGYVCDWSGLAECLAGLTAGRLLARFPVRIHGHALGTEDYRDELVARYGGRAGVTFDGAWYEDDAHTAMLARHHVGLAFYLPHADVPNWRNLVTSSGKIAAYAWAGLAIVTNLDGSGTDEPPFVPCPDFDPGTLQDALGRVAAGPDRYRTAALALARRTYDLDAALDRLQDRLLPG